MWISSVEYSRLLTALDQAEHRATTAQEALAAEREARMADVRHLMSMLLRRANSYPLPEAKPVMPESAAEDYQQADAAMDPGEYEALVEAGLAMGLSQSDIDAKLATDRPA